MARKLDYARIRLVGFYYGLKHAQAKEKMDLLKEQDAAVLEHILNEARAGRCSPEIQRCPLCDGPMVLRSGRNGDFWGCMKYPDCTGTRNINAPEVSLTDQSRAAADENLKLTLDFIEAIGGIEKAKAWIRVAEQAVRATQMHSEQS